MPVHDWTRVDAGIFHHFHHGWIAEIARSLNRGLLPPGYYALLERLPTHLSHDALMLRVPKSDAASIDPFRPDQPDGGVSVAEVPPPVRFHATGERVTYARKANAVVVRHRSMHQMIAVLRIVSPGNKASRRTFEAFAGMAEDLIAAEIHLLLVDVFPPGNYDPGGIHEEIWGDRGDEFVMPPDKCLTCAAYVGGDLPEAYVQPVAVRDALPDMPLFLAPDVYVPVPLEGTYQAAWEAVPAIWREVLTTPTR